MMQLQLQEPMSSLRRRRTNRTTKVSIDKVTELDEQSEFSPVRKRNTLRKSKYSEIATPLSMSPTKVRLLNKQNFEDDNDQEMEEEHQDHE